MFAAGCVRISGNLCYSATQSNKKEPIYRVKYTSFSWVQKLKQSLNVTQSHQKWRHVVSY